MLPGTQQATVTVADVCKGLVEGALGRAGRTLLEELHVGTSEAETDFS